MVMYLITGDKQGAATLCDADGILVHVNQKILHYKLLGITIAYINLTSYHSSILRKQKALLPFLPSLFFAYSSLA